MKTMNFEQMEIVNSGGAGACVAGSFFSPTMFVAGVAAATVITAGAAGIAVISFLGGVGVSCFVD